MLKTKRTDRRPELSATLKLLPEGPQWFTWPNPPRRLRLVADEMGDYYPPRRAIIVHRGRFGLAWVWEKDGIWAGEVKWINGRSARRPVRVQLKDVRAIVTEEHERP